MRKIFKNIIALATSAMVVGVTVAPSVLAWGDNSTTGLRRGYTRTQIESGVLGDKAVFNSITDGVFGDERNFVAARDGATSGDDNRWYNDNITVEDGKEYVIRLYVHNNNPRGTDVVARDTKVAFSIPQTSAKKVQVNGFIQSSNADPGLTGGAGKYWDYVNFNSDNAFHLEYVSGSALLENQGIGKNGGVKLGNEIVTQASKGGVLIGYDALDGRIPGCLNYDGYVSVRVKAVFDTDYRIDNEVRVIGGEKKWANYVNAQIGDIVEFRVSYTNLSKTEVQNDVAIKHILPKSLRYVAGTTKLINSTYPDGTYLSPDGSIVGNGVNIGNYNPNANAYVYFRAEVVEDGLACGKNTLVDWAQGGVGTKTIQDYASVITDRVCDNPNKLPDTGPASIAGGIIATGSVVTAAGYFIASRRSLR